jgi:hypothetical protein
MECDQILSYFMSQKYTVYANKKATAIKKATYADNRHHSAETFSLFFTPPSITPLAQSDKYYFYRKNT